MQVMNDNVNHFDRSDFPSDITMLVIDYAHIGWHRSTNIRLVCKKFRDTMDKLVKVDMAMMICVFTVNLFDVIIKYADGTSLEIVHNVQFTVGFETSAYNRVWTVEKMGSNIRKNPVRWRVWIGGILNSWFPPPGINNYRQDFEKTMHELGFPESISDQVRHWKQQSKAEPVKPLALTRYRLVHPCKVAFPIRDRSTCFTGALAMHNTDILDRTTWLRKTVPCAFRNDGRHDYKVCIDCNNPRVSDNLPVDHFYKLIKQLLYRAKTAPEINVSVVIPLHTYPSTRLTSKNHAAARFVKTPPWKARRWGNKYTGNWKEIERALNEDKHFKYFIFNFWTNNNAVRLTPQIFPR